MTNCEGKAAKFPTEGKAFNVLNCSYPKNKRSDFHIEFVGEKLGKIQDQDSKFRFEPDEECVSDLFEKKLNLDDAAKTLEEIYSGIFSYREELRSALKNIEAELCDCEHACEFLKCDAANGYKLYKMMHTKRIRRRYIKNELRRIGSIVDIPVDEIPGGKIRERFNSIDTQVYEPRVLMELFNG